MNSRPGYISGLLKLFMLGWLFDWLQDRFGFSRGCSCIGIGCGIIMLFLFVLIAFSSLKGTNWTSYGF